VVFATVFSCMALLIWIGSGFVQPMFMLFVLLYYWIGAFLFGSLLGLLRPLGRTVFGAAFVGFIISALAHAGSGFWMHARGEFNLAMFALTVLTLGLVVGVPFGVYVWNYERKHPD
jgi:hypothetical protein